MNSDRLFDAMLKAAMEEAEEQKMATLPSEDELDKMYPTSDALDKRIMKLISNAENRRKRRRNMRVFTRIAATAAVLVVACTAALMSVEPSRIYILNSITSGQYGAPIADFAAFDSDMPMAAPAAVAESFEIYGAEVAEEEILWAIPRAAAGAIEADDLEFNMDFENFAFVYSTIVVNGQEVTLIESSVEWMEHVVTWTRDNITFQITAAIPIEELLTVVESLIN